MFGILNFHKPIGVTSRDCVNQIQRIIRPIKCGHAGTLDPIAEGVLLIGVGQAVRLVDWIHLLPKTYLADFQLGKTSPSVDCETEVTDVLNGHVPSIAELEKALISFQGPILQTPPIYSAIRIDGKRAHELARAGKRVEIPPRTVEIHRFKIIRYSYPDLRVEIDCSTGTYVRSLGRDLARCVGTDAIMTALVRTRVGDFGVETATSAASLTTVEDIQLSLVNPLLALTTIPRVTLHNDQVMAVLQGKQILLDDYSIDQACGEVAISNQAGVLQSIVCRRYDNNQKWSAKRNFHAELVSE
ncbi:MAG: tRNA pseudouridine(55) synthase TruB [Planctomycetota bacterium]|nr:tRNA pseudouridine(55) synthase TruB [Planctomycetota bacterium]